MNYIGECISLNIEMSANTADAVKIKVEEAIDAKTTHGERDKSYAISVTGPNSYRDRYSYTPTRR
jgi:hypothetical protein